MAETSKVIVERQPGGAVVSLTGAPEKKRPVKTALEEDEFTEALTTIIRRDFFPDVPKLEAQLEFIKASETNDYERLRAISERFTTTHQTPQPTAATPATFETPLAGATPRGVCPPKHPLSSNQGSSTTEPPCAKRKKLEDSLGLDQFLSKHESEDDAAFSDIMEKTKAELRDKHAWLYEKEREYTLTLGAPEELLAITDGSEGSGGGERKEKGGEGAPKRSGVKSWTYTAKNSLMYYPDGVERSALEKVSNPAKKRQLIHSNTRLSSEFVRKMHRCLQSGGESERGGGDGKGNRDKVGIDGMVPDPSSSPQVNGYGFVATPQIQPGVDASPLMTWGSIEGTPLRLETDITPGHGPTFKMPKVPKREELAHRLADKATKSTRDRKKAAARAASPALLHQRLSTPATPSERLQLLSPAARKLASRTVTPSGSLRGVDKALRQSYTPSHSTHSTPKHKSSNSGTTPILSTPDSSSTPSLTDNLLNLKSR